MKFGVAANVLNGDRDFKKVPDFADFLRGLAGSLEGIRHGQQVMGIRSINAAPAQMIAEPGSLGALDQSLESLQMFSINWFRGAKVHGNPMLDDLVALKNLIEDVQRPSPVNHVILGDYF